MPWIRTACRSRRSSGPHPLRARELEKGRLSGLARAGRVSEGPEASPEGPLEAPSWRRVTTKIDYSRLVVYRYRQGTLILGRVSKAIPGSQCCGRWTLRILLFKEMDKSVWPSLSAVFPFGVHLSPRSALGAAHFDGFPSWGYDEAFPWMRLTCVCKSSSTLLSASSLSLDSTAVVLPPHNSSE